MNIKVAYVCSDPGVPVFGRKGCSIHVQEVVRAMLLRGEQVHLFARRLGGPRPAGLKDLHVHRLQCPDDSDVATREQALLAANAETTNRLNGVGAFDRIYERLSLFGHAGMEFARDQGCLGILEVNAPLIEEQETYRELVDREAAVLSARRAIRAADRVAAVSSAVASTVRRLVPDHESIRVVGNGVDINRFRPEVPARRVFSPRDFVIGFIGVPKPWHDLATLFRAVLRLRQLDRSIKLLIVGKRPGGSRGTRETHQLCSELGKAVHITGPVDHDEVPPLLAGVDVAAAPYPDLTDFYFSPLKVLEYMACGRAIVATNIGEIPQFVADGETGLLVDAGDEEGLARACSRLRHDPLQRLRLGQQARHRVIARHTWKQVVERTLQEPRCTQASRTAGVA